MFIDHDWPYQPDFPVHTADMTITFSGGDAIFAEMLGSYLVHFFGDAQSACNHGITWKESYRPHQVSYCGQGVASGSCAAWGNIFNNELRIDLNALGTVCSGWQAKWVWCHGADIWGVNFSVSICDVLTCDLSAPTIAVTSICKNNSNLSGSWDFPTATISSYTGTKTPIERFGSASLQASLQLAIIDWLTGTSPSTDFTLKLVNNTTSAVIGTATMSGPWTYHSGSGCYEHPHVNVTTTASHTHSQGLRMHLFYGTQDLGNQVLTCTLTGQPNPLPSGTTIEILPLRFRFTSGFTVPGYYTGGVHDLLNQLFLLQAPPTLATHVVKRNGGGSVVEDMGAVSFSLQTGTGGYKYGRSTSDIIDVGASVDSTRLESNGYLLSGNLLGGSSICPWWYPAGFIQFRL